MVGLSSEDGRPVTKSSEMSDLVVGAYTAGRHVLPHLLLHGWPPEALLEQGSLHPQVTGDGGGVGPVDHLRAERDRDKQTIGGPPFWGLDPSVSFLDSALNAPGDRPNYARGRQNREGGLRNRVMVEELGKGIGLGVLRAWSVGQYKMELVKE